MPSKYLTKKEKAQCKVVLCLLVTTLLLQEVSKADKETGNDNLPAVAECTNFIDEILAAMHPDRRAMVVQKIQITRIRMTKKIAHLDIQAGLVAALRVITSGMMNAKAGTRFGFIKTTFSKNLIIIEKTVPVNDQHAIEFEKQFKKAINSI